MYDFKTQIELADKRIAPYVCRTPLSKNQYLSRLCKGEVFLKMENLQHSGSFKLRGAFNKLSSLDKACLAQGIVTASTGCHGLAVAYAAERLEVNTTIYLPHNTAKQKLDMLRHYPVQLESCGDDCMQAETRARQIAEQQGKTFISPYNDLDIIAGQGTIAKEIIDAGLDNVFVAVGGGGLVSGIASYLKQSAAKTRVIGCSPINSAVMHESVKAGKILELESLPTLSDATAGGVEADSCTFAPCCEYVDDWLLVSEQQIVDAMRVLFDSHRLVVEGAAGVATAALVSQADKLSGQRSAVILCGANIDAQKFLNIIAA